MNLFPFFTIWFLKNNKSNSPNEIPWLFLFRTRHITLEIESSSPLISLSSLQNSIHNWMITMTEQTTFPFMPCLVLRKKSSKTNQILVIHTSNHRAVLCCLSLSHSIWFQCSSFLIYGIVCMLMIGFELFFFFNRTTHKKCKWLERAKQLSWK